MKVLITGGAGFIGSHLVDSHIAGGDETVVLDDFSTGSRENIASHLGNERMKLIVGSVLDMETVRAAAQGVDRIYHMAAAVGVKYIIDNPLHSLRVNLLGTENVMETANEAKIPIFVASTSEIYGKNEKIPFKETDDRVLGTTLISRWGYSCSKAMDEFLAIAYYRTKRLPVVVGRLFNTVGPRQTGRYGMVIPRFVKAALMGRPIPVYGTGEQTRCFSDVSDIVRFVRALMDEERAIGRIVNLGGTERVSIEDLAKRIIEMTRSESPMVKIPYEEAFEKDFEDMMHRVPDVTLLHELTGLEAEKTLDDILLGIVKYFER